MTRQEQFDKIMDEHRREMTRLHGATWREKAERWAAFIAAVERRADDAKQRGDDTITSEIHGGETA